MYNKHFNLKQKDTENNNIVSKHCNVTDMVYVQIYHTDVLHTIIKTHGI